MKHADQVRQAEALRGMHDRREVLVLPNAWDAGTARLFEERGVRAIATTSGGVAWALGYGDGQQLPLEELLAAVRRMVRVVRVPVTVDFEGGYGATPAEVGEAVGALLASGAVGMNIEDGMPGHGPQRELADAVARIRAARETASAAGVPLVINARVDNWIHPPADPGAPLADALARARAYLAAGADCIYPIGLTDAGTIGAFVAVLDAPVNVMASPSAPPVAELARLGVARVSTATRLAMLALDAADRAARSLLETGRYDIPAASLGYPDAQRLFSER